MSAAVTRLCPLSIVRCTCMMPGANPKAHGQRPKSCIECGGETGFRRLECVSGRGDTRIVEYELSETDYNDLVAEPGESVKLKA
jgi:hypothetical protein